MYKLDLPIDQKESAAIERRRANEQQRQSRIFNAKTRQIGIDYQGLDVQIQEKREQEKREKLLDEAYAAEAARNDKIACLMEAREKEDRARLAAALTEFHQQHQTREHAREWDLNNPDQLKKAAPARVSDDDPRITASNALQFDGEDLNKKAREKHQSGQMQAWLQQQIDEKRRAKQAADKANELYDLKRREMDGRAVELANAEDECRRAIQQATANYNLALKQEAERRRELREQQEADDTLTHVQNALTSDLLSEDPAQAMSAFGPHRVVPDRFKGMLPAQLERIKLEQEAQARDAQRRRHEEANVEREWERQRAAQARIGMLLEREQEKKRRELVEKTAHDNLELAKEQKAFQEFLDNEVYRNEPTAAYFMKFNTCSR